MSAPAPKTATPASPAQTAGAAAPKPGASVTPIRPGAAAPASAASGPETKRLKKGELLFREGENSRSMYYLKTGMLRIFKKKGNSSIEIDTLHAGQIIGELAFLDGNPRSASAEALTNCELSEVSGTVFTQTLGRMPDWLKLLLKTVVGRLRTASTRIRQLEQASVAYEDGKKTNNYVYLSTTDVLKVLSAVLLVVVKYGKKDDKGYDLRIGLVQRYANQIMGVPVAKITDMVDVLSQAGFVTMTDQGFESARLTDPDFLEATISWMNEQNLLEANKKLDISLRSFIIMTLVARNLNKYPKDAEGVSKVNIGEIRTAEMKASGKEPFRMDEAQELVKTGLFSQLTIKSNEEVYTNINADHFAKIYRIQRLMKTIDALNEQKRK